MDEIERVIWQYQKPEPRQRGRPAGSESGKYTHNITVSVPIATINEMDRARRGTSRSHFVSDAIKTYIKKLLTKKRKSKMVHP